MATESSLVLLHLSDLHFTGPDQKGHYWNSAESTESDLPEHDRKGLLGRLMEDPLLARIKPSLVVVSGDLLDKAHPSGTPLALAFLNGLAERLSLKPDRFALVPGNHDASREPSVKYQQFDEIYRTFYGTERSAFAGKAGHERADLFDYPDFGILIAGFNSSENLDADHPQGSVGEFQRDAMTKKLADIRDRRLRIAVMHHHLEQPRGQARPDLSVMNDPGSVREWLLKNEFSLVLHGHQHVDWQTTIYERGWRLTVAAAGSLGVGNYGRERWRLPLSYQLVIIRNHRQGLRLRREYSERECKWGQAGAGPDGRNSAHQELPLGPARGPSGQPRGNTTRFVDDCAPRRRERKANMAN
jgi:3',5'-cyclic AMP phosphodiesterase CpdA